MAVVNQNHTNPGLAEVAEADIQLPHPTNALSKGSQRRRP